MKYTRAVVLLLALLCVVPVGCTAVGQPQAGPKSVLAEYRRRMPAVRDQLPQITAAAEAVARRWVERQQVLIHVPSVSDSESFGAELAFRAGGLDNIAFDYIRQNRRTAADVVLYGPRSWEKGGDYLRNQLPKDQEAGNLIIVFGSKVGMPPNLPIDFLIDNGARGGGEDNAAINQAVNVTNGWLWCCELTAALTRLGQRPAILKGMTLPGSTEHNGKYQHQSPQLYPIERAIPAGALAAIYLEQIEILLAELESPGQQTQIAAAADLAAGKLREGHNVWVSSFTHVLDAETLYNRKSPVRAFRGISAGPRSASFANTVLPGDLLFWIGEWTANMPGHDNLAAIRRAGVICVPGFRPIREPMEPMEGDKVFYDQDVSDAPLVLEQHWPYENAVVPIPFPPGRMAPVSGVYACLQFRMLDAAVAQRVVGAEPEAVGAGR